MVVEKRKVLLINPNFQLRFIVNIMAIVIVNAFIFYGSIFYLFYRFEQEGLSIGLNSDHLYFEFIKNQKIFFQYLFVLSMVFIILFIFFYGLIMSHRIAGPIYRLLKFMKDSMGKKANEIPYLKFRDKDYFPELAESFNEFVDNFNDNVEVEEVEENE